MSRNLLRVLLLVAACLNTRPIQAVPAPAPESLPKLPFEGEPPQGIVPENPQALHPADRSSQAEGVNAAAVNFLEAAEQTALAPPPPYTLSHVQGEFSPDQSSENPEGQNLPTEGYRHLESGPLRMRDRCNLGHPETWSLSSTGWPTQAGSPLTPSWLSDRAMWSRL